MFTLDQTLGSGIFKFSNKVKPEMLADMASALRESDPNFVDLHVRGCDGQGKNGIGFKYRHDGTKEGWDAFIDRYLGRLTRTFPNDLVGWDISSSTYLIG